MTRSHLLAASAASLIVLAGCARPQSQAPTPSTPRTGVSAAQPAGSPSGPGGTPGDSARPAASAPKPYARVITKDAKTRVGMFKTHLVGEKLYFEIPRKELNRDMLLVGRFTRSAATPGDFQGYGGDEFTERTLRWERSGNRVILRSTSFAIMADTALPVSRAVMASNNAAIVAVFPVESYGPDSAAVVDVTRLYTTGIPEFSSSRGTVDEKRSFIERAIAFPENVEVEATQTSTPPPAPPTPGAPPGPRPPALAQSVIAHWSMVHLPDRPMMPRYYDDRVGYFSARQIDFGSDQHRSVERRYITRYRLEKKDPAAAMSEPVKPIVYYIDPATPAKWIPFVRAGIEEWQPAFEAAGFTKAIIAKDAPTFAEDPDWSPEDVRNTVVRWLPSTVENAVGPHTHDPRTGEILNGSVRMFHNILNLQRSWYFTQVAPLDPRAQRLPFPDSLMGKLLQFVVAHEVGHTLGFQHNMKASSMYPADSVRSASWVAKMGHSPSIMDYARFNYVAQPEDKIAVGDLIPRVGTYDAFATMWGYKPIPSARTPEQERATLDEWARQQDTVPWFRFSTSGSKGSDSGELTEAIGDADAVKSTELGLRNIKRIVPMLMTATTAPGEDNSTLSELYTRLIGQWRNEMVHVANVVGGAESQEKYGSQMGARFTPFPQGRQRKAVMFLNENAFRTPTYFLDPSILRRLEPDGAMTRVRTAQTAVLASLLGTPRLVRLIEYNSLAIDKRNTYTIGQMLGDVRRGVWSELTAPRVQIDGFRRNLQYAYLDQLASKINPPPAQPTPANLPAQLAFNFAPMPDEARAQMRNELVELDGQLRAAGSRASDQETRVHLAHARHRIDSILFPTSRGYREVAAVRLEDLPTPCLVLDRIVLEKNLEAMRSLARRHGVMLRPHLKTAKSAEVARLALGGEKGSITVSTLAEAEYFAGHGFRDMTLAAGITPQKLGRAALVETGVSLNVITDDESVAKYIGSHASNVRALIEIDSGEGRGGIAAESDKLLSIGLALGERLAGVLTHGGHSYSCRSAECAADVAEQERTAVTVAAERLRDAGLICEIVSLGSTPSVTHARELGGVTEARPGVYMFQDLFQAEIGSCGREDIALTVLASVIGRRVEENRFLVDAGSLALSKDRSTESTEHDAGFGLVWDIRAEPVYGECRIERAYQEHGLAVGDMPLPFGKLSVGEKVRIAPNHACLTAAAYDCYYVVDGGDEVVAVWDRMGGW